MAVNLGFLKRLIKEDFEKKDQDLVGKVGSVLNPALDQITRILAKGLTLNDLNSQVKDITLQVDSSGVPTTDASFKVDLQGKCGMVVAGRVQNLSNTSIYPTNAPFISFIEKNGQIVITHITGLQTGYKWQLRVVAFV